MVLQCIQAGLGPQGTHVWAVWAARGPFRRSCNLQLSVIVRRCKDVILHWSRNHSSDIAVPLKASAVDLQDCAKSRWHVRRHHSVASRLPSCAHLLYRLLCNPVCEHRKRTAVEAAEMLIRQPWALAYEAMITLWYLLKGLMCGGGGASTATWMAEDQSLQHPLIHALTV